jgi:hypothetical protein
MHSSHAVIYTGIIKSLKYHQSKWQIYKVLVIVRDLLQYIGLNAREAIRVWMLFYQLAEPIATTDFVYLRFIGGRSIDESI